MKKIMDASYLGNGRTEITHREKPEGTVRTDGPGKIYGDVPLLNPTEMLCAALAGCILMMSDVVCKRLELDLAGSRLELAYKLADDMSRLEKIEIDVYVAEGEYDKRQRVSIERAGMTCPVGNSLHPDIEKIVRFHFD